MDVKTRKKLIDQYKDGYRAVADSLADATADDLDARPAPGKWTAREVVHHLADSEMTAAIRLRRLLAADNPAILGYDQDEFARRLHYERPIGASLDAFKASRSTTGEILDCMSEDDWRREGTHNEHGRYTIEKWLEIYSTHAHKHAEQIKAARDSANKK